MARHPARPYTLDYVKVICDEFQELAGDRAFADDKAIVGGLARIGGRPVMIVGHQKGRDTKEKIKRNFGMPKPEGYRKALRLMNWPSASTCPSSPSSTPPAHGRASMPRSAASPKPLPAT
jgi:acetyl-CoA carboxylase alpha subunit